MLQYMNTPYIYAIVYDTRVTIVLGVIVVLIAEVLILAVQAFKEKAVSIILVLIIVI